MNRYDQQIKKKYPLIPIITGLILLIIFATWMFLDNRKGNYTEIENMDILKESPIFSSNSDALDLVNKTTDGTPFNEQQNIEPNEQEERLTNHPQLTELENSDDFFKRQVSVVSTNLSSWFGTKDVIKKYIVLINDISQNQIPSNHTTFLMPLRKMVVKKDSQGLYLTNDSYRRYDDLANAIAAIDVDKGLELYILFKPLFAKVYEEFSYPADYQLEGIFLKAAKNVINAPVIEDRIALVRHSVKYSYADKKLELFNKVEKQMIRMGPENTRKIQKKMEKLVQALTGLKQ